MRRGRGLLCCAVFTLLSLPLSAQIPIDGRVRDSGGAGLAGARVELRPILSSFEQGSRELDGLTIEPAARTVTGADGRFELLAPDEGMWEVGVSAEGYVPQRFRLAPLTGPETLLSVRLRRDAGLRVRVEGPDGRPLAGARVVGRAAWRFDEPGWEPAPRIATSGADGVARLPATRQESLVLLAMAPGFPVLEGPEARGPGEVTFRLAAGTPRRVEAPEGAILRDLQTSLVLGRGSAEVVTRGESWLRLETAGGVQARFAIPAQGGAVRVEAPASRLLPGKVIDSAARQPVAGAWVWPRDDPGRFARTDGQGVYRMEIAGLRRVDLAVAAAGLLPEVVDESIPWPEGGLPAVALDPEVFLSGTVEDGEGNPAAGAEVAAFPEGDLWHPYSALPRAARVGRVSAEGKVRIAGLRPGSGLDLLVTGSGFAPAWLDGGRLQARENRFVVVLSRGGRVRGRIEDAQGSPVAGAEVRTEPGTGTAGVWKSADPAREGERFTVTAADGGFALADLPPGWYEMTVRRPGAAAQRLPRFEVSEGAAADLGALRLDDAEELSARLVDSEGRPVAGAEVWASVLFDATDTRLGPGNWPAAVSGPDGGFSLRASRWLPLWLSVCGPGFVPLGMSVPGFVPGEPLVLTLRRGAAVSGRATGADGLPDSHRTISVKLVGRPVDPGSHPCGGQGWSEVDEAGRFRVAGLEPGLYSVDFGERLELAAGESREVAVREGEATVPHASFSGRLLGTGGLPIPGAVVRLAAYEQRGRYLKMDDATSRTDADGNYRLDFARPGLQIERTSFAVARHGRSLITPLFSPWEGPPTLEAEGRIDIPLESFPVPLAPTAAVELADQRSGAMPVAAISGRILGLGPGEMARVKVSAGLDRWSGSWTVGAADAQGSYRLDGLHPQRWWIRVEAADRVLVDAVQIPEGETRITRDLVFPPVAEVTGEVETPGHEPVAGATVRLRHHASPFQTRLPDVETRTGSDGSFQVRLPAGEYEVTASREGFVPVSDAPSGYLEVEDGKGDSTEVWLRPAVELRGRLSGLPPEEDEVEIEAVRVDADSVYPRRIRGRMTAEGRYAIPGLAPGTWDVEAACGGFGFGDLEAAGRVVIPEEATAAVLDLAFSRNTD